MLIVDRCIQCGKNPDDCHHPFHQSGHDLQNLQIHVVTCHTSRTHRVMFLLSAWQPAHLCHCCVTDQLVRGLRCVWNTSCMLRLLEGFKTSARENFLRKILFVLIKLLPSPPFFLMYFFNRPWAKFIIAESGMLFCNASFQWSRFYRKHWSWCYWLEWTFYLLICRTEEGGETALIM